MSTSDLENDERPAPVLWMPVWLAATLHLGAWLLWGGMWAMDVSMLGLSAHWTSLS